MTIDNRRVWRRFAFYEDDAAEKVRDTIPELFWGDFKRTQQVIEELLRLVVTPGIGALITRDGEYVLIAENLLQRLFFCCKRMRHVKSPANNLKCLEIANIPAFSEL